ncbi:hypothetical protein GCM10027360_04680 [Amycolatopsis echigonensis]
MNVVISHRNTTAPSPAPAPISTASPTSPARLSRTHRPTGGRTGTTSPRFPALSPDDIDAVCNNWSRTWLRDRSHLTGSPCFCRQRTK